MARIWIAERVEWSVGSCPGCGANAPSSQYDQCSSSRRWERYAPARSSQQLMTHETISSLGNASVRRISARAVRPQ